MDPKSLNSGERVAVLTLWGNVSAYATVISGPDERGKVRIRWEETGEETETPRTMIRRINMEQESCQAPDGPHFGCPVVGRHVHTE